MTAKPVSHSLNRLMNKFIKRKSRSTDPVGYGHGAEFSEGSRCGVFRPNEGQINGELP